MAGNRDYLERTRVQLTAEVNALVDRITTKEAEEGALLDRLASVRTMPSSVAKTTLLNQTTTALNSVKAELITLRNEYNAKKLELDILQNKIDDYDRSINEAIRDGASEGDAEANADRELDGYVEGQLTKEATAGESEEQKNLLKWVIGALIVALVLGGIYWLVKRKKSK